MISPFDRGNRFQIHFRKLIVVKSKIKNLTTVTSEVAGKKIKIQSRGALIQNPPIRRATDTV